MDRERNTVPGGEKIEHGQHVNPNTKRKREDFIAYIERSYSKSPANLTPDDFGLIKNSLPQNPYGCLSKFLLAVFGGMFLLITTFFTIEYFKDYDYMFLVSSAAFAIPPGIVLLIMAAGKRNVKAHFTALEKDDYTVYVCPYKRKLWSCFYSASKYQRGPNYTGPTWYCYYVDIGGTVIAVNLTGFEYDRLPVPGEIRVVILNIGNKKKFIFLPNPV